LPVNDNPLGASNGDFPGCEPFRGVQRKHCE